MKVKTEPKWRNLSSLNSFNRKNVLLSRGEYSWGSDNSRRWKHSVQLPVSQMLGPACHQMMCFPRDEAFLERSPEEQTCMLWMRVLVLLVILIREQHWGHESSNDTGKVQISEPAMLKMKTGLWGTLKVPTHIPQKALSA